MKELLIALIFMTLGLVTCIEECSDNSTIVRCSSNPCEGQVCQLVPGARCIQDSCGTCNYSFVYNGNNVTSQCDFPPCPPNLPVVLCFRDPCDGRRCPGVAGATCVSNYCGGCNYVFFSEDGTNVTDQCNTTCTYSGRQYAVGEAFPSTDGCNQCSCTDAGVACTERACVDTCSLPPVTGPCRAAIPSYFYNQTSQRCERFVYGGCGGNSNRFRSVQNCLNQCNNGSVCLLPAESGPCEALSYQFFFNSTSNRCEVFNYGGCQGNGNRFASGTACAAACHPDEDVPSCAANPCGIPVCEGNSVLVTEGGRCCPYCSVPGCTYNGRRYTVGSTFPSTDGCNECSCTDTGAVACTERACLDICSLTPVYGDCLGYYPSYFYNQTSRRCERFIYDGCGGNRNRFRTIGDCLDHCDNRSVCLLRPEPGPCDAVFYRFFFNSTSSRCELFNYGGCGGNGNRFSTGSECAAACNPDEEVSMCEGVLCDIPVCTGNSVLTYDDSHCCPYCSQTGCTYNGRRYAVGASFPSTDGCNQCSCTGSDLVACTLRACINICTLPPVTGVCEAYIPSYFYNQTSQRCERFIYGGCGGNRNRFSNIQQCMIQCGRSCSDTQFTCSDGTCVNSSHRCDGIKDCRDASDEMYCPEECEFRCSSGQCIDHSQVCDKVLDCRDGSDARNCSRETFTDSVYLTPSLASGCPSVNSTYCSRAVNCEGDYSCSDGRFCCYNQCGGRSCMAGVPLDCRGIQRKQQQSGLLGAFTPDCQEDGNFSSIQCQGSYCWCVNVRTGQPVSDGVPVPSVPNCDRLQCMGRNNTRLMVGESQDTEDGCNTCICTAQGLICSRLRCENAACKFGDQVIKSGATYLDQCNTCNCSAGSLACRRRVCTAVTGALTKKERVRATIPFSGDFNKVKDTLSGFKREVIRTFLKMYGSKLGLEQDQLESIEIKPGSVIIIIIFVDSNSTTAGANVTALVGQVEQDFDSGVLIIRYDGQILEPTGEITTESLEQVVTTEPSGTDGLLGWHIAVIVIAAILVLVIGMTIGIIVAIIVMKNSRRSEVKGHTHLKSEDNDYELKEPLN